MIIFCDREYEELMYYIDGNECGDYLGSLIKNNEGKVKAKNPEREKLIKDMFYDGAGIKIVSKEEAEEIINK